MIAQIRMDFRTLSIHGRRETLERKFCIDLSTLAINEKHIGHANERNCEQMFGHVPIPVGYAGPLSITLSCEEKIEAHLPLATTEAALIASVNRGCKALREAGGAQTTSIYHGITRSIALRMQNAECRMQNYEEEISLKKEEWVAVGEATSNHLKILKYEIDTHEDLLFLTIYADTDEAMGMNMVTIAAEEIGKWMEKNFNLECITVAANVDSDKKPSQRTKEKGRGYEVTATAVLSEEVVESVLKTTPKALLEVAHAKLKVGSEIAGALGKNCHAANIIAALYLATGQDAAHVVEGSLAETQVKIDNGQLKVIVRNPAILVGIRGGGTTLPAQSQALNLLLKSTVSGLQSTQQLAETIGAAVLAGELSLLAAQSSHTLAKSHKFLARSSPLP